MELEEGDKDEDHFHIPGLTLFEFRTQDGGPSYPLALVYPGADSDMLSLPDVNLNEGEVILHRADLARTTGAMVVVGKLWRGEVFVVVIIVRTGGPLHTQRGKQRIDSGTLRTKKKVRRGCTHKVICQVLALIVQSIVHERRDDSGTCDSHLPQPSHCSSSVREIGR